MKQTLPSACVTLSLLAFAAVASATEFAVGRATVHFKEDGWRIVSLPDEGKTYSGDVSGTIQSETKLLVNESPANGLNAVAVVRASAAGMSRGYMQYSPQCKSDANWHAKGNAGFNRPYSECVRTGRDRPAQTILSGMAPNVLPAISTLELPAALFPVFASYASSNGTFLEMRLFVIPGFTGRDGQVGATLPTGVLPKFVLLGEEVGAAVRDSVTSQSGKLEFPALGFSR